MTLVIPMRHTRRYLVGAALLAAVGGAVALALRPKVLDVETAVATRGPLVETVDADAKTRVVDRYVLTAPVTGRLHRVLVEEGDAVARGQTVAWIAPVPLDVPTATQGTARLDAALALANEAATRVSQARATLDQARRATGRLRTLLDAGAVAPVDFENAETTQRLREEELSAALAHQRAAAADVQSARAALTSAGSYAARDAVPVRAPVAGHVLRVPEHSERIVAAGAPVLELGDTRALEVVTDVLSTDAVRIRPGAEEIVAEWGGDSLLHARVKSVEPGGFTRISALGVEEQRVNVVADLPSPPPSLGDGYRVEARIVVWRSASALAVPASALFQRGDRWHVFTVEDGRARLRPVDVGHRGGASVEIVRGLEDEARVILFPSDKLVEGARVR